MKSRRRPDSPPRCARFASRSPKKVSKTGLVVYKNGEGPTVMVRAELDALPIEEKTGLAYARPRQGRLARAGNFRRP